MNKLINFNIPHFNDFLFDIFFRLSYYVSILYIGIELPLFFLLRDIPRLMQRIVT